METLCSFFFAARYSSKNAFTGADVSLLGLSPPRRDSASTELPRIVRSSRLLCLLVASRTKPCTLRCILIRMPKKVEVIWLSLFLLSSRSLEICWMESEGCFLYCRLASNTIRTRWLPASEADVDDRAIRKSRSSRGSRLMKAMSYGTLL